MDALQNGGAGFYRFLAWARMKPNDVNPGHAIFGANKSWLCLGGIIRIDSHVFCREIGGKKVQRDFAFPEAYTNLAFRL